MNPESFECSMEDLQALLSVRTRMVAFPHVSNVLGHVVDAAAIARAVHAVGGRVVVDGVAYAPHHAIDVAALGADWYLFSPYKVYGPHMSVMFGRHEAFGDIVGPNHFFFPATAIPTKFELGGVSHEACAGLLATRPYLQFLAGRHVDDRETVVKAFATMERLEAAPSRRLLDYLQTKPDVRLIGSHASGSVGTVSFVHRKLKSAEIVGEVDKHPIGIRHGHMYAYRLVQALGLNPEDGVVRVSLVHYNTVAEIDRLIDVFESVL
jgi:selenocysteine lyase/cysteine desulfurase